MRSAVLRQLERRLEALGGRPSRHAPVRTGVPGLDDLLPEGGLPRGRAIEWRGPRSCGKTAVLRATLGTLRREGEPIAVVDGERTFFAPDWWPLMGGETFWVVRPPRPREAVWCADLLLRSGAFGAVALETAASGPSPGAGEGRNDATPLSRGIVVRLQRLAEEAGTLFIVVGELPLAALRLHFRPGRLEPLRAPPFGPILPPVRPVWVGVGRGGSAEVPVLCPVPGDRTPRPASRDRKGPRRPPE